MAVGIPGKGNKRGPAGSGLSASVRIEYPGKKTVAEILNIPPKEYYPDPRHRGGENRLYHADNLGVLASLATDKSISGKVRLVYIDPPFASEGAFHSRHQRHAYDDHLIGAEYIEYLRERLIFLHKLLSDDGSLYLHLDGRMAFHFRVILDEIFGEQCFRSFITRKKCNPKNYTRKTFGNVADYILFYTKTNEYVWNRPIDPWDEARAAKEYPCAEGNTGRRYKKVPIHAPGARKGASGGPWHGMLPPPGKHWQYLPSTLDEMNSRGEIYWSPTGNPRRKVYLDDSPGIPIQDIWMDMRDAHNQNIHITGYPTEKNPELLARIIEASSNPGDLVMDCFSGSGTTLGVASQLGRRWIGVDRAAEAIKATLKRFSVGTEPMGDFVQSKKSKNILLPFHRPIIDFTLHHENINALKVAK